MFDRSSPTAIRNILQRHGLFPKKRLGQNFLIDRNILSRIADSCAINPDQYVVEIGPGLGGLTQELAMRARGVLAVEVDNSLEPILQELAAEYPNLRLCTADILKINIEDELRKAFAISGEFAYQVCANIPYNITTPIIFQLLEDCTHLQAATLMMQKEVAVRLLAAPGGKEYGRLTLTASYYADIEHVFNVSRGCFYPRPDVDSAVVRLIPQRPKKVSIHHEEIFQELIRAAFQKRRKTILNITSAFFRINKEEAAQKLQELGLDVNLRPENLSLADVARLINKFTPDR